MKTNCEVIQDLIPLCVDRIASDSSQSLVSEHIRTCEQCRSIYNEASSPAPIPVETETNSLRSVKRNLFKRIALSVLCAVFMIATVLWGIWVYNIVPVNLKAEEVVVMAEEQEDGYVRVYLSEKCDGTIGCSGGFYVQNRRSDLIQRLFYPEQIRPFEQEKSYNTEESPVWYVGVFAGEENTLLWGEEKDEPVVREELIDRTIQYLFYSSLIAGLVICVLGILLKKKWICKLCFTVGSLLLCCAAACVFVTDGRFLQQSTIFRVNDIPFHPHNSRFWRYAGITGMTLFSWLTLLCAAGLIRLRFQKHALK